MAYSYGTPTVSVFVGPSGREEYVISITETEASSAAGAEWVVAGLPKVGRITLYKSTLTAGTGTAINPKLGATPGFTVSTQGHLATNSTTAAHINDATSFPVYLPTGTLYGRSSANNAATDHAISTIIVLVAGSEA